MSCHSGEFGGRGLILALEEKGCIDFDYPLSLGFVLFILTSNRHDHAWPGAVRRT